MLDLQHGFERRGFIKNREAALHAARKTNGRALGSGEFKMWRVFKRIEPLKKLDETRHHRAFLSFAAHCRYFIS